MTLSIFMSFIWSTRSSTGRLVISGGENFSNSSLKTAEEYNLKIDLKES
jgi:HKD family nuclease